MAGLDPAIHAKNRKHCCFLDGRIKCGHDNKGIPTNFDSPAGSRLSGRVFLKV